MHNVKLVISKYFIQNDKSLFHLNGIKTYCFNFRYVGCFIIINTLNIYTSFWCMALFTFGCITIMFIHNL